jgi:uncharacterized protein YndB with AHSA1/START domain
METKQITVKATVNASVEKCWEYYTDPVHVVKWSFADESWHSPKAENDLRIGGRFLTRMEAKDTSEGFDFTGTYDDVVTHQKISYTMDGDDMRKVSVVFEGDDKKTDVTVTFDAEEENPLEFQQSGWQSILNKFKEVVESE